MKLKLFPLLGALSLVPCLEVMASEPEIFPSAPLDTNGDVPLSQGPVTSAPNLPNFLELMNGLRLQETLSETSSSNGNIDDDPGASWNNEGAINGTPPPEISYESGQEWDLFH